MNLRNKSSIVTGAASGIGKEIALRFAREGDLSDFSFTYRRWLCSIRHA